MTTQPKRPRIGDSSAAERNKRPIFDALMPWLVSSQRVLEIGAGEATHARHAVDCCPQLTWQASEAPARYPWLQAAMHRLPDARLPEPIMLDVAQRWPVGTYDGIYGANILHIMSWADVQALFAAAPRHLSPTGWLALYGPVIEPDEPLGVGNQRFDAALRARDPAMGLRRLDTLDRVASAHGLRRVACLRMPSDNRLMLWQAA